MIFETSKRLNYRLTAHPISIDIFPRTDNIGKQRGHIPLYGQCPKNHY